MRVRALVPLCITVFCSICYSETACLTTAPPTPPFTPSAPYDSIAVPDGSFWYGTSTLWTQLGLDATWHMKDNADKSGGYAATLVLWAPRYDWRKRVHRDLFLTARRIDADAPFVAETGAKPAFIRGKPAIITGIRIPTGGCWEVGARYGKSKIAFLVTVQP